MARGHYMAQTAKVSGQARLVEGELSAPPAQSGGSRTSAAEPAAEAAFALGEVYAFPNPAKGGQKPTLHIEAGTADSVEIRLYDLAGDLVQEAALTGAPALIDDGQGPQLAYEHALDSSGLGSGVYMYAIRAKRAGAADLKATGKVAIIK